MKLAVIGAGKVGSIIVCGARQNNIDVVVGSRNPKNNVDDIKVLAIEEAIKQSDTIVVAIPGTQTANFLTTYKDLLLQKTVIDVTNDITTKPFHHLKDAEGLRYTRAFSMLGYEAMDVKEIDGQIVDIFFVANETEKEPVETLIKATGLRPVYVGGLDKIEHIDNLLYLWGTLAAQYRTRNFAFKVIGI
ncbi:NAD(P)-binding domain-containing protein [Chryseobacterium sp. NEB161]|nr:NAD(P)-binding domain-containing protein [Chryseobacterium sp. NEB161]